MNYQDFISKENSLLIAPAGYGKTHALAECLEYLCVNERLVNFENDLSAFEEVAQLNIPWRWHSDGNNEELGTALKKIRTILTSTNKTISSVSYTHLRAHE